MKVYINQYDTNADWLLCHASEGWHPDIKKRDASLRWHDTVLLRWYDTKRYFFRFCEERSNEAIQVTVLI